MSKLTNAAIKGLDKPGRYGDGGGLYLNVAPGGSKSWIQRIRIDGNRTDKGLGGYPAMTLTKARQQADANRIVVKAGRNPWTEKRMASPALAAPVADIPTLREATYTVHNLNAPSRPASAARWIGRLEKHILASVGDTPIDEFTRANLAEIIGPLRQSNHETSRKVKQALHDVFRWSVAMGHIATNPADDALEILLPKVRKEVTHHLALPHGEVRRAVHMVKSSEARLATRLLLQFIILTAARAGEARLSTWGEIDLDGATWTVPASRMKNNREHVVPLSAQAAGILRRAKELYRDPDEEFEWTVDVQPDWWIFPNPNNGKPISDALAQRLDKDGIPSTMHGFRTSFRTWAAETYGDDWDTAAEMCLSHYPTDAVVKAYQRSGLVDKRRGLLAAWADYVDPVASVEPPF